MLLEAIAKELENNNNQTAVVRIISKTGFLHDFCSPSSPHQVRRTCDLRQRAETEVGDGALVVRDLIGQKK